MFPGPNLGGCSHPECTKPATHERRRFPLCLRHFMLVLQWEQAA